MTLQRFVSDLLSLGDDYPTARLVEIDDLIAVFEVTNGVEDYRVSQFGGEREQLGRFLDAVDEETVLWDVGANVGLFSVFAARAGATVHAFEPEPEFASHLRRNVELNGQDDIQVHEFAISDENGRTTLYTDGVDGSSPGLSVADGATRDRVAVETRRGVDLDIEPPTLLKVDVEGAETAVLRGIEPVLQQIETVMLELHPEMLPRFDSSPSEPRELLQECGFDLTWERSWGEQIHLVYRRETGDL